MFQRRCENTVITTVEPALGQQFRLFCARSYDSPAVGRIPTIAPAGALPGGATGVPGQRQALTFVDANSFRILSCAIRGAGIVPAHASFDRANKC